MCHILQVLDTNLIDNPKQHQHCMSPDSEYITLIAYAITLGIDMCNFLAIWAVLSILLDNTSSDLPYVQCLQQVYDSYYDTHTQETMAQLEQQVKKIQDIMYHSLTKHDFDSFSGADDREVNQANTNNSQQASDFSIYLWIIRVGKRVLQFTYKNTADKLVFHPNIVST